MHNAIAKIITLIFFSLPFSAMAIDSQCGPDQGALTRRFQERLGITPDAPSLPSTPTQPTPMPPVANGPVSGSTPRQPSAGNSNNSGNSSRLPTSTPQNTYDPRDLGSYYYDRGSSGGPLSRREQQQANNYRDSAIALRQTPVSWNKSPFDESQRRQINQMLDRLGVNYDKNSNTISPSKNTSQAVEIEDRVRKVIQENVREPINDVNNRLDVIIAKLREIEGLVLDQNYLGGAPLTQPKVGKKKKTPTIDRVIAALPQIEPEQAAANPNELDQIVNNALYIKDSKHWNHSKSISTKETKDNLTTKYSKEAYRSISMNRGNEIRILELIDAKDTVAAIKAFVYQSSKRAWVPVFYKLNADTGTFDRQATYHDQKLPYACLNCHGNSPRSLNPDVNPSASTKWPKK